MKLFAASASPYVRKVKVFAMEHGLSDRIEDAAVAITPLAPNDDLNATNPLGKIPALQTDDGRMVYDSRVICEHLSNLAGVGSSAAVAASADERLDVSVRQALGDGILDAAVNMRYETFLRPEALRWGDWVAAQQAKIDRALDAMTPHLAGDRFDLGDMTFACALAYLDFRYADNDWRPGRPELAKWYEGASARPSMQATVPA